MATAAFAAASLEDTYRLGDSDAENDDADQVGKDIDEFEARLRGDRAASKPAPATVTHRVRRGAPARAVR